MEVLINVFKLLTSYFIFYNTITFAPLKVFQPKSKFILSPFYSGLALITRTFYTLSTGT